MTHLIFRGASALLMATYLIAAPMAAHAVESVSFDGSSVDEVVRWSSRTLDASVINGTDKVVHQVQGSDVPHISAIALGAHLHEQYGSGDPGAWIEAFRKLNGFALWVPATQLLEQIKLPQNVAASDDSASQQSGDTSADRSIGSTPSTASQQTAQAGPPTPPQLPDRDSMTVAQLAQLANQQQQRTSVVNNELASLRQQLQTTGQRTDSLVGTVDSLQNTVREGQARVEDISSNVTTLKSELEQVTNRLEQLDSQSGASQEQVRNLARMQAMLETRISQLEAQAPPTDVQLAERLGYGSFYESYRSWFIAGYMMLALALLILVAWIGTALIRRIAQKAATRHVQQRDQETLRQQAQETAQQEVAPVQEQLAAVESEVSGLQTTTAEHGRRIKGAERRLDSAQAHRGLTEVVDRHRTPKQPTTPESEHAKEATDQPAQSGVAANNGTNTGQHGTGVRNFSFCDGKNPAAAYIHGQLKPDDRFDVRLIDHDASDVELAITCRVLPRPVDATDTKVEIETVCGLSDKRAAITYVKGGHLKRTISKLLESGNINTEAAIERAKQVAAA
jgi:archaellum component FlaC